MSENLSEAFVILAVGMITVFVILALVVLTGKALIQITNQFAPPSPIPIKNTPTENAISKKINPIPNSEISVNKKKIAAVIAAVDHITEGKGSIKNIKKL